MLEALLPFFAAAGPEGPDLPMGGVIAPANRSLISVNPATGRGEKYVLPDAGISRISFPTSLAWDGTDLFMVAIGQPLAKVDRTTGALTTLGVAGFGVSENEPRGLAWDGTNLYMIGSATQRLYTLDRTTGVATAVGPVRPTAHSSITYGGLDWDGTNLYAIVTNTGFTQEYNRLYRLNRTSAAPTRVGASTNFGVFEDTSKGPVSVGSKMYMVGSGGIFYELNKNTGVATRTNPGPFGLGINARNVADPVYIP